MNSSIIYALDFDGVICDSAVETAMTGWKAATRIWDDMPKTAPQVMIDRFRLIRPIIETGFEAILAIRLLYLGNTVETIYTHYGDKVQALLQDTQVSVDELKTLFGETRDIWIANDLADWINMNPLFDGVAEKLKRLDRLCPWYVVTTKQERFVKQLLKAHAIALPDGNIFGLGSNMNKIAVLKRLSQPHPDQTIYFVEDRLPTLMAVLNNEELTNVELFLALWGYNTDEDKSIAVQQEINLLQLNDFLTN
jgi:phosphoglycolate phosphatase-like HAD superfamily hydrolase